MKYFIIGLGLWLLFDLVLVLAICRAASRRVGEMEICPFEGDEEFYAENAILFLPQMGPEIAAMAI